MPEKNHDNPEIPDFSIETLGAPEYESPLKKYMDEKIGMEGFVDDNRRIVYKFLIIHDILYHDVRTSFMIGMVPLRV